MKLKKKFIDKTLAWAVSLTMAFTMIPALGVSVYADEEQNVEQDNSTAVVEEEQVNEEATEVATEPAAEETVAAEEVVEETEPAVDGIQDLSMPVQKMSCGISGKTNPDALLEGYIDTELGIDHQATKEEQQMQLMGTQAYKQLSATGKVFYNKLKVQAAQVANGSRNNSVFTVKFSDLGLKTKWTAAELGVSQITVSNAAACRDKIQSKIDYDPELYMKALMSDNPYEMYWFDKVEGYGMSYYPVPVRGVRYTSEYMTLAEAEYDFMFSVSVNYSPGSVRGSYNVDLNKTKSVSKAVANIKQVVKDSASMHDFQKLLNYAETICDNVTYNHEAADDASYPYGNPWQLIWVFDNDPNTNVVCEGYSKAFQYLCDLTKFDKKIVCHSVSGVTSGPHMWNIVEMDDGYNYLVDLTNCDSVDPYFNYLFLAAPDYGTLTSGYKFYYSSTRAITYKYNADMASIFGSILELNADTSYAYTHLYPEKIKLSSTAYTYTGKSLKPSVKVYDAIGRQIPTTYYNVTYPSSTVKVGKYKVTVSFLDEYSEYDPLTTTYNINPVKTGISKLSKGKKRFTVKWTKKSSSLVNGYQIQYSTSSTFASGNKTVTVKSYKTKSKTVKSLKAKKKYYVRVRTYKKVGTTYFYSAWSAAKAVTTK